MGFRSAHNNEQNNKGHYQEPQVTAREAETGLPHSQSISGGGLCPLQCVDRGHLPKLSDLVLEAADRRQRPAPPPRGHVRSSQGPSVGVGSRPTRARTGWHRWLFETCYCFPRSSDGPFKGHFVCVWLAVFLNSSDTTLGDETSTAQTVLPNAVTRLFLPPTLPPPQVACKFICYPKQNNKLSLANPLSAL
ncbi:hypothetical protein mRhiFer1_009295 [Rhinolophus ferrumequinum]|uniref:Uncharacterized protein n=1 Tax=Rhinolophus ferrumequinum TaxID=59479 RepID=A0A7J7RXJ8_RHIFE|nr:hypothetical protein mRhiFer1_009295 [Rhinolophus ferrumequinum]